MGYATLTSVSIGVGNLEQSMAFYSWLGLEVIAREIADAEALSSLWGVDLDAPDTVLLGRRGIETGRVQLIQLPEPGPSIEQQARAMWHPRFLDICIEVRDTEAALAALQPQGITPIGGPVTYELDQLPGVRITETLIADPDASKVALIKGRGLAAEDAEQPLFSEVATATQVVPDLDRASLLYREALGMEHYVDIDLGGVSFEQLMDLPRGTRFRLALFRSGPSHSGKIELLEFPRAADEEYQRITGLPSRGLFGQSFRVDDAERTYADMISHGAEPVASPRDRMLPFWGTRLSACVRNDVGTLLELIEA